MPKTWFTRLFRADRNPSARRARRVSALRRRPMLDVLEGRQLLATFQVTSPADSGAGTLRQAILASDATPATPANPNVIQFVGNPNTNQFVVNSQLPAIAQPTTLDASNLNARKAVVQIIGNYAGSSAIGLDITASGTVVRDLVISGFNGGGILIDGASNVTIDNDVLGLSIGMNTEGADPTNPTNMLQLGNGLYGLTITNGAQHNVISNDFIDNTQYNGLIISKANTDYNVVTNTAIGTDNTFAAATDDLGLLLGNGLRGGGGSGVVINQGASYNTIGGTTAGARDVIVSNKSYGVYITDPGTTNNVVAGDSIGVNQAGTADNDGNGHSIGNGLSGVAIVNGAFSNSISGTYGALEYIGGNGGNGVVFSDSGTAANTVSGVYIGVDATGQNALANSGNGVVITNNAASNVIGGSSFIQNVISGNLASGVVFSGTSSNTLSGNLIGTNAGGNAALPNGADGVLIDLSAQTNIIGGPTISLANVISGNASNGIEITGPGVSYNVVWNNFVGTDVSGEKALGNNGDGVLIHGMASANTIGAGNVISANQTWGVYISDSGTTNNVVDGDFIGLDATGVKTVDANGHNLGNAFNGLDIYNGASSNTIGGTTAGTKNVISGNLNEGILIGTPSGGPATSNNVVEGNFIGTDLTGTLPRGNGRDGVFVTAGATGTVIGGATASTRNIISGNIMEGLLVYGSFTTIEGDSIGTDVTGTTRVANEGDGVGVYSATAVTITNDLISGNFGSGVLFGDSGADDNQVTSSLIGTDVTGTKNLGNAGDGVLSLNAVNNNVISDTLAFNGDWGVLTNGGIQTLVAYDSIFSNVLGGIGVANSVTVEPAPLITAVTVSSGQTSVFGLTSAPTAYANSTVTFQFFASPAGTGNQGKTYLGQVSATTDTRGNATFAATFNTTLPAGQVITATLTDLYSNTSPFSNAFTVPAPASTASFVGADTKTQGNWRTSYGADGYDISQDTSATNPKLPSYAQLSIMGATNFTWATSNTDVRDLQNAANSTRIAAVWYSTSSESFNLNLTDGQTHRVGFYVLDWDGLGRSERFDVIDTATGTVLNSQTVSNFQNGTYLTWNLSGNVTVKVTSLSPSNNVVVSGIFFGAAPTSASSSASFVGTDTTTQGNWRTSYGADGYDISQDTSATNPKLPSYAQLSIAGASNYTWATSNTDVRDLQNAANNNRIAAVWYSTSSESFNLNLTDGQTHRVGFYVLDWDGLGRSERFDVIDTATGTVLNTQTVSNFQNGTYLTWNLSGNVTVNVTNLTPGANAVVSGIFFGAAPMSASSSASFLGTDTTTQGNWRTSYGADGYDISQDTSATNPKLPSYAQLGITGASNYTWATSNTDVRDLQNAANNNRIAAVWYSTSSESFNLNLTDGQTHRVGFYVLDWDGLGRSERFDVIDTATGTVLDSQTVSSFQGGKYLSWNLSGNVTIKVTNLTPGANAVVSGIFFG